jgi:hypothetical protein
MAVGIGAAVGSGYGIIAAKANHTIDDSNRSHSILGMSTAGVVTGGFTGALVASGPGRWMGLGEPVSKGGIIATGAALAAFGGLGLGVFTAASADPTI